MKRIFPRPNVAGENPGVIKALEVEYNKFMTSLKEK